ncbi:MAG: hypothetical protein PHH35_00665 [Candidatus Pacebacteria bacterium]|jgi:hypothetical protein|nr:hypothetical protein [Candidatus Paceibacterota bacterium]
MEKKTKDKCVICGIETRYKNNVHIQLRENYIEGGGQLCQDCWEDLYKKKKYKKERR